FSSLFSFSSLVVSVFVPSLGDLLTFMELTTLWVDSLPYSIITNLYLNGFQLTGVYVSIIFLLVYFDYHYIRYLKLAIASITIVFISMHVRNYHLPDEVLYVANIKGKSVVNYINPNHNIIYTNEELTEKEIDFAFSGLWAYYMANSNYSISVMNDKQNQRPVVKLIGNQSIAIVPERAMWDDQIEQADIDKLILLGKPQMKPDQLETTIQFKQLVIPNGWKWYDKRKWFKEHAGCTEKVHDISKDGVLITVSGKLM
ncbi:MAG: hypothetical protein MI866_23650, partial [Bacteroidales bacterium]|nr:hypothetical protein [Bacteroidales bacterium]